MIDPAIDSEIAKAKLAFHGISLEQKQSHQEDTIDDLLGPEG